MVKKRYYFPYVAKGDPMFRVAVTSKTLMEKVGEVTDVFKKYAENSNPQTPTQILFLMSQHNESLFDMSECESELESDSTSSAATSCSESSSSQGRNPSISSVKRKHLSFDVTATSDGSKPRSSSTHQTVYVSPSKEDSSTISKATDQSEEFTSTETSGISSQRLDSTSPKVGASSSESSSLEGIHSEKFTSAETSRISSQQMDSTSPKISTSSSESSSLVGIPGVLSLEKEPLSDDPAMYESSKPGCSSTDQTVYASSSKMGSSTISKATDVVSASRDEPQKLTSTDSCLSSPQSGSISPSIKSSPGRSPSVSRKKRKHLTSDDSADSSSNQTANVSDSGKISATTSEAADIVLASHESGESTSMETSSLDTEKTEIESSIKTPKMEIDPETGIQECGSPNEEVEMDTKPDSESPAKEFKVPELPVKDEGQPSKPVKRPKLCDSAADIPKICSPSTKSQAFLCMVKLTKDDKMDASPDKVGKVSDTPCTHSDDSPDKSDSLGEIGPLFSSIDEGIEIDMPSKSEETPVSSSEMENLSDEASRVEYIRKEVQRRLKDSGSPEKTKGKGSTSKKNSNPSPRRSKRINSPSKGKRNTRPDPEIKVPKILSHPNVIAYLKLRFKSVLSHRNKYMKQIYKFLEDFKGDLNYLFLYSKNVRSAVEDIPVQGKIYDTRDLQNLKGNIIGNSNELCTRLRPLMNTVKSDIPFWEQGLKEIRKLNEKNEFLLSAESGSQTTIELLREYESNVRRIWERMDRRILLGNGLVSSLLRMSADFKRLTRDFANYLLMVELMKPSSLVSSKNVPELRRHYH